LFARGLKAAEFFLLSVRIDNTNITQERVSDIAGSAVRFQTDVRSRYGQWMDTFRDDARVY
jgi:hypothetical protein